MRIYILQALSVLLLALAVIWFIFEPGFEPVITAVAGLVGLFSAEFIKPGQKRQDRASAILGDGSETADPVEFDRKSIVVLPFDNMSPDAGDAYFSDGLTEEIITDLTCCGLLRVISRNSSMVLKDTRKDTKSIAEELGVQYVLEGSVRKDKESLLVTAQLIDAEADEHVWAERFSGTLEDVFEIQGQLSRSIVDSLRVQLTSEEEKLFASQPIQDTRAYDAYLRATHEGSKLTPEGVARAIRLTEDALAITGENALLAATLAQSYYMAYDNGFSHSEETLEKLEHWAKKAVKLDPELGKSQWAMALVRFKRADLPAYVRYGRRAVRLGHDSFQSAHLAIQLSIAGRIEEARDLAESAIDRDPLTFFCHAALSFAEVMSGHPEIGLAQVVEVVDRLAEGESFAHWWVAQVAGYAGDEARALQEFEYVAGMKAAAWSELSELFRNALLDDRESVRASLAREELQSLGNSDEWFPVYFADVCARVGDFEEALRWLEQAVSWGFSNHRFLAQYDRYLEPLREDSRFQDLVDRAETQSAAFEA